MASTLYPREDVSQAEKNKPEYFKARLDYAESLLKYNSSLKDRMSSSFDGYNGIKTPGSTMWLEKTYGEQNKSRYRTYRLGRTKIDLLCGEQLKRPLQATVTTINSQAMTDKMLQYDFMIGAMAAKKELIDIKQKAGVDVMEGAQIPDSENDPAFKQMSFKDKCEDIMQIIGENQIKDLGLKGKFNEAFKNCALTNYCYFKVERNETGDIEAHNIDPRDRVIEDIEGDDYGEKSPIHGCRQTMFVHQILKRYNLSKEDRDILNNARANPTDYAGVNGKGRGYMTYENGQLSCDVIHIEWKSVTPEYVIVKPKTASQLALDSTDNELTFPLTPEKYESNKEYYDKGIDINGKQFTVETKFREEEYEATRIGGIINTDMRRTFFQKRGVDNPAYIMSSSYYSYVHGRTSGISISLQQIIENFENIYDIAMYKILQDFARMKGKSLTVDRGGLGKNQKLEEQLHRLVNDGIIDWDSSAVSNQGGRYLDPANMFKTVDLGLSESFQQLLAFRDSIRHELDNITGVNENRMGITAASSTATAQQSDIANSRTITESLFYGFSGFVQRVMLGVIQSSAISWAFYKLEKGEQILGSEKFRFLQVTQDIGFRDYGVTVEDGSRYMEVSQKIEAMMQVSLNAKEIRPMDALNVLLAETVAQKKAFLESSWVEMKKIMQESEQANNQMQQQIAEQQNATNLQIAKEDREDAQQNQKDNIILQGQVQMEVDNNKAKNSLYETNLKTQADIIKTQPPV